MWQIDIEVPMDKAAHFLDALESSALSSSCFESPNEPKIWIVSLFMGEKPNEQFLTNQLKMLADITSIPVPFFSITALPEKDWVTESQRYFTPLIVGKFYIHTSWHTLDEMPAHLYPIEIDPSQAFGTGTHDTTQGCLLALTELAEGNFVPKKILDMGTGTGILAVAARHLWPNATIIAADNDQKAVSIAQTNSRLLSITTVHADSFIHPAIITYAPFDLIIANILAIPLIEMAPKVPIILAPSSIMVLSGFYDWQMEELLATYRAVNLIPIQKQLRNQWGIVTLEKK